LFSEILQQYENKQDGIICSGMIIKLLTNDITATTTTTLSTVPIENEFKVSYSRASANHLIAVGYPANNFYMTVSSTATVDDVVAEISSSHAPEWTIDNVSCII
jgi:hypothetical protein